MFQSHLMSYYGIFISTLIIGTGGVTVRNKSHIIVFVHICLADIVAVIVIICVQRTCVTFILHNLFPIMPLAGAASARRKPGTGFSDAISGGLSRPAAQTSERKNAIERFFSLICSEESLLPFQAGYLSCPSHKDLCRIQEPDRARFPPYGCFVRCVCNNPQS